MALVLAAALVLSSVGCTPRHPSADTARYTLTYLGQAQVAFGETFDGTVIGGLSAISYDAQHQLYYVISDDRSKKNPARFYTVQLSLSDKGIDKISFTATHPWLDRGGQPFAPLNLSATPPVVPPDPEGIAFDPGRQRLYWSSEGERLTDRDPVLADPWVRIAALDGSYLGQFTLPPNLAMSAEHTGPRRNMTLEGLALTPDGRSLYAAMEDPGYNDGPLTDRDHQVLTRITKLDVDTAAPLAQYAYPMEPPGDGVKRNGVSDLVALSDTTFLVVERSTAIPPVVRIYRAEIGSATDVLGVPSLQHPAQETTAMSKSLAVDLTALNIHPDNVEGITLGPKLPDGRQSVVLVTDNNFSPIQVTQFLLLAM